MRKPSRRRKRKPYRVYIDMVAQVRVPGYKPRRIAVLRSEADKS